MIIRDDFLKKNNKSVNMAIVVFVALLIVSFISYQIYLLATSGIETEYAEKIKYDEKITSECFLIRNEKVIETSGSGSVISFNQASGCKVAANSVIAESFSNEDAAKSRNKIIKLQSEIDNLKSLQKSGTQLSASAEKIELKIENSLDEYISIAESGSLKGFQSAKEDLTNQFNKMQIATGSVHDFSAYIANLESQVNTLQQSLGGYTDIYAPCSGYFVDVVDGFENAVDFNKVSELTIDDFNNLVNAEISEKKSAGKICVTNEWYISFCVEEEMKKYFKEDESHIVTLPDVSVSKLDCIVKGVNEDPVTKKALVIMRCDQINGSVLSARKCDAEITVKSYNGLKVNSSAVRIVDGVKGVYIKDGNMAYFKMIEVLYYDSNYTICDYDMNDVNNKLQIYDEVIISGSNLYNGKVLQS